MKKITISIVSMLGGAAAAAVAVKRSAVNSLEMQQNVSEKHLALFLMMNQWVAVKQQGKNLAEYFEEMQYKKIAIYGMGYAGERLLEELKGSGIDVKYGIDRNSDIMNSDIDIVTPDDELEPVDAIVVTPVFSYDEIERKLTKKVSCPVISLEDILYLI